MQADPQTLAHYEASVPYYTLAFDRSHSRHLDAFLDRSHRLEVLVQFLLICSADFRP